MARQLRQSSICAKAIRAELKKEFSGIKFQVTSKSYSGGNSVDVFWIDGPSTDSVRKVIGKYQYGHFDGMTDCYDYSNRRENIPQVKFVFANRRMSSETKANLVKKLNFENYITPLTDYEKDSMVQREFNYSSF
jgi:hypothetical protein